MKKTFSALVVAASVAFAPSAHAQFAIDLKLAYAIPMGDAFINEGRNQALSDSISGAMPLGIDARYRFTPNLSAGVYFQYSPAFVKSSACEPGTSCSASNVRLGIEAVYGFMPEAGFNPWVSLGTGWEWATFKQSAGGLDVSATLDGWEYFNVQVGGDFALSKMFSLGPYVGFSGGSYSSLSASVSGESASASIPSGDRTFHSWFQFGVKGSLNL